jgi:cellulose synthase/poly-beta-1,6-N-acetylglucosamine synthase-like glycosyltransferase
LRALVELDYPNYEIIVVDDGSSDDTFALASAFVGCHERCTLKLLRKPNGGKWSALNLAFEHATADLILCIDADSRISRDALKRLIMRINEPSIAGVSGQITVRNRRRLITRFQAYEYVVTNGGLRTAQSLFGLVLVVPGPIGLYRRQALQDVFEKDMRAAHQRHRGAGNVAGPFSHETFAEDFQLSLTILALGCRIVYEPSAVSYTKSPDLTHALLNQRYRWYRGTVQVLRIYLGRLRHLPGSRERRLDLIITAVFCSSCSSSHS